MWIADICWAPLYTIYRVLCYLRLLALSISTCSPSTSFLDGLVSYNSRSLEKVTLGALCFATTLRKNLCTESEFLFMATCASDLTCNSYINFRYINGFPELGSRALIRSYHRGSDVVRLDYTGMISILVVNCIQDRILHRFRDYSLRRVQHRYRCIWLHLLRLTPYGRISLGRSS